MNKELVKLLPNEQELLELSVKLDTTITSRNELLVRIGMLDLGKTSLEEKMVYVLGLVSLGFEEVRARKRLGVPNSHFYIWQQQESHKEMLESSVARGEMVLEEKVLLEAEQNPKLAFEVLKERKRTQEKKEDKNTQRVKSVWDMMQNSGKERGIFQDGNLIDEVLE